MSFYPISTNIGAITESYISTQIFDVGGETGTYTPTAGTRIARVYVYGASGAGGGVDGQGAGTLAIGEAGGNGGLSIKDFTIADYSGFSYIVGTAGAKGAAGNNAGGSGTLTSFTATLVGEGTEIVQVTGGTGGDGDLGGTATGNATQGAPGVGSGGDVNITGNQCTSGRKLNVSGAMFLSIPPNNGSPLFGGGKQQNADGNGADAEFVGAGGLGGLSTGVATNYIGGNGFRGEIRIEEYA